jgi:hypothetical protein
MRPRMRIFIVVLCFVIFFAIMFAWREFVHFVVEDLGIIPGLALIGGIFAVAWAIDRHDEKKRRLDQFLD